MYVFDYVCVYNPDLGDESCVEKQLVYTDGALSTDEFLKVIGVAQGLAELAHSFDHAAPARWFDKGAPGALKRVFVVPLPALQPKRDWRQGYWLCCQESVTAKSLPPQAVYALVEQAHAQYALLHANTDRAFAGFDLGACATPCAVAAVAPHALPLAPGTLSPSAERQLAAIAAGVGLVDVLITLGDGACVFAGTGALSIDARVQLARWLARPPPPPPPSAWDTLRAPPVPSLRNMASLSSLRSMLFRKLDDAPDPSPDASVGVHVFLDGRKLRAVVTTRGLYIYAALVESDASDPAPATFDALAEAVEGFSFAFAPPVAFDYVVHNPSRRLVVSTLPAVLPPRLLAALTSDFAGTQQVVRTAKHWILYSKLSTEAYALVLKQCEERAPLLGSLHAEIRDWLAALGDGGPGGLVRGELLASFE